MTGSEDQTAIVWDATNGGIRSRLKGHTDSVTCALLINDDTQVVTGSYDHTIRFWDASSGHLLASLAGRSLGPNAIASSPDGNSLAYCALDHSVIILDVRTRQMKMLLLPAEAPSAANQRGSFVRRLFKGAQKAITGKTANADPVPVKAAEPHWQTLAFSMDGTRLAAAGLTEIRVWDLRSGATLASFEPEQSLFCLAFSPNGKQLASCALFELELWDVDSRMRTRVLEGHTHMISAVTFSPDGRLIVSEAEDATMRVWSAHTGTCVGVIAGGTDTSNLAKGSRYIGQTHETNETSFIASASGDIAGWFPGIIGMLRALPDGFTWAGMNRTGQIYILRLEGPADPIVPALDLVPFLNSYWRAAAYHYLQREDRIEAAAMLSHREAVCQEFGDTTGLAQCEVDRLRIKPRLTLEEVHNLARATDDKELLRNCLYELTRAAVQNENLDQRAIPLLDELLSVCRDLNDCEGVRQALTLKMKVWMDAKDDASLLPVLHELAAVYRQLGQTAGLINTLGMQTEVLSRGTGIGEAVAITKEMEQLSRDSNDAPALIQALWQRVKLYRLVGNLDDMLCTLSLIIQAGYDSNDLKTAQAGLAEQAFIHMDRRQADLAGRVLNAQEEVCRRLGDPRLLVACLINNSLMKAGDKSRALAMAREARQLVERHSLEDLKEKICGLIEYLARA